MNKNKKRIKQTDNSSLSRKTTDTQTYLLIWRIKETDNSLTQCNDEIHEPEQTKEKIDFSHHRGFTHLSVSRQNTNLDQENLSTWTWLYAIDRPIQINSHRLTRTHNTYRMSDKIRRRHNQDIDSREQSKDGIVGIWAVVRILADGAGLAESLVERLPVADAAVDDEFQGDVGRHGSRFRQRR